MPPAAAQIFRLYLMRHAQAGWALPGQKDFDRTLDDTGYAQAEMIADRAADRGFRPDKVLCSTATRCRETAEALHRAMGEELEIDYTDMLYAGPANVYTDIIDAWQDDGSLMLVGHNPMMEELVQALLGETAAANATPTGYPCAGLAVIDIDRSPSARASAPGRLVAFLAP
ncbi:SixA phosphatase family protein [Pararhizobium antarcticum]|nr:histidine phosphatase family protein [Pararhizobium antarcticum]